MQLRRECLEVVGPTSAGHLSWAKRDAVVGEHEVQLETIKVREGVLYCTRRAVLIASHNGHS